MSQVIINDVSPYTQATAVGSQVIFGTNWTANAASDVVVYVTPVGTDPDDFTNILSYPTQYTVDFIGALEEVQVTLVTPSTAGDIVTVTRMTPADRENLYSNTNFVPSMLNNDFGILTLVDQQAQLVNQQVAPRYNYSATIDPVIDGILPTLEANQVWIKDSNNTGFIGLTIQDGQVGSGVVNIGSQNQLAYYAANGDEVSGLTTAGNSVLVTNVSGIPSISDILPSNMSALDMVLSSPSLSNPNSSGGTFDNPTLTSAQLGTPDSGVLTNCTGLPSGTGIKCTNTNDSASSGQLGEFISSVIPTGSAVNVPDSKAVNVTSISLTAGDWDVFGNITWPTVGIGSTAAYAWTSTTPTTPPDYSLIASVNTGGVGAVSINTGINAPFQRYSLSTTTPIYLSGTLVHTGGPASVCGGIYARRVR